MCSLFFFVEYCNDFIGIYFVSMSEAGTICHVLSCFVTFGLSIFYVGVFEQVNLKFKVDD